MLGRLDGEGVGLRVGDRLGRSVGDVLGPIKGEALGLRVGDLVGCNAGGALGSLVGLSVTGLVVGVLEGLSVGGRVGTHGTLRYTSYPPSPGTSQLFKKLSVPHSSSPSHSPPIGVRLA